MTFDEYQKHAVSTDTYEAGKHEITDMAFINKILGINGETGELTDKFKKIMRDKDGKVSDEDRIEILKETGDVLWYLTLISTYMGSSIGEVADMNVKKLADRYKRRVIHGAGDNR